MARKQLTEGQKAFRDFVKSADDDELYGIFSQEMKRETFPGALRVISAEMKARKRKAKKEVTIFADDRKSNPRKRKAINAKSQITGKRPSARLRRRRAANTMPGYFPNPDQKNDMQYRVEKKDGAKWLPVGTFKTKQDAFQYAEAYADTTGKYVRVLKD